MIEIVGCVELGEFETYDLEVFHEDHSFVHSAGIVTHNSAFAIANRPIHEFIPTETINGVKCTSYTASSVEKSGAIKNDFLVVNAYNDISEALKLIQINSPVRIPDEIMLDGVRVPGLRLVPKDGKFYDIWNLPQDSDVFNEIAAARTETVFQCSTPGAQQWLEWFNKPNSKGQPILNSITELANFTALNRPGPLDAIIQTPDGEEVNMLQEYSRRAQGFKPSKTPRIFSEMLQETKGILIYQESVEKIYKEITGCSGPEAEKFRSNVAKKKKAEVEKAYPVFMKAATEKYGEEEAKQCWDAIQTFSRYGFNKSMTGETILMSCEKGPQKIKDFSSGEHVYGVDDMGKLTVTEVLALHDHGMLDGWEIEFSNGQVVTTSIDHKFLTTTGMVPLKEILAKSMKVLTNAKIEQEWLDNQVRPDCPNTSGTGGSSTILSAVQAKNKAAPTEKNRLLSKMWDGSLSCSKGKASSKSMRPMSQSVMEKGKQLSVLHSLPKTSGWLKGSQATSKTVSCLCSNKTREHRTKKYQAQSKSKAKTDCFGNCKKDIGQARNNSEQDSCVKTVETRQSRKISRKYRKNAQGFQKVKTGTICKKPAPSRRSVYTLRRKTQAGRYCFIKSPHLDRNRWDFSLCQRVQVKKVSSNSTKRRNAQQRSFRKGHSVYTDFGIGLFQQKWDHEAGMAELAYADAPLSHTGGLVFREIVRATPVGRKRMYDLEVAHPKHNFLLPSGIVTSNSHSVSYMHTAYACAYLKYHFPLEWWAAVLTNATKDEVNETFWEYCGHLVDLPDIRYSKDTYSISNGRIVAPVSLMNGIGEGAHKQLCRYLPYENLEDFVKKIQLHKEAGVTTKEVIKKKINKKTGEETSILEKKVRLGHSALNRGVVYTLIISGAMDALFEPGLSTLEKLHKFEELVCSISGKKIERVPEEYKNITELQRYQLKKSILPSYSAPLLPLLKGKFGIQELASGWNYTDESGKSFRVLTNQAIKSIENRTFIERPIFGVIPAFVVNTRTFNYDGGKKTGCSITFDLDGRRYSLVKWPDRNGKLPEYFNSTIENAVVLIHCKKYKVERPFVIEDIEILSPEVKITRKEKDSE